MNEKGLEYSIYILDIGIRKKISHLHASVFLSVSIGLEAWMGLQESVNTLMARPALVFLNDCAVAGLFYWYSKESRLLIRLLSHELDLLACTGSELILMWILGESVPDGASTFTQNTE